MLRRKVNVALIGAGSLVLVGAAFLGGAVYGAEEPRPIDQAGPRTCQLLTGSAEGTPAVLRELAPDSHYFAVSEKRASASPEGFTSGDCSITGDSKPLASVELSRDSGTREDWEELNKHRDKLAGRGAVRNVDDGYSTATTVALYVPCAAKGEPGALSVRVTRAESMSGDSRKPMLSLAKMAAEGARSTASCA
ncbi:hypothetical protein [Streptomyces sp. ODS28]|uniref:hypothetical protein n=1 Tax=Streptomyces sp. ODS28 TaxID=3136688 RepID=UPI0031E5A6A9